MAKKKTPVNKPHLRQPISVVMGHVDHGKTKILDFIRRTAVAEGEAGGITQHISSWNIPLNTIKRICGHLIKQELTTPGILFLDSPGHAAFINLRKRGGSLADIAILVIDINEGIMPQTKESIEILKQHKTPFLIALNKIDLIPGWKSNPDKTLIENINSQAEKTKENLDKKLYEILGKLHEMGFESERFDRVDDYSKQIAMIPTCAKTGEGIPELLMILSGLAQKFLEECLECKLDVQGKGTVLEIKEEKGLGTTLDIILYEGNMKVNDCVVIGALNQPIVTKIRSILEPEGKKFKSIKQAYAARGIKIVAPDLKEAVSGMPIRVSTKEDLEKTKQEIREEIEEVLIETDKEGVVIKADSLGSLEALIGMLKEKGMTIKRASIGNINKKDLADASAETNDLNKVILGFNVNVKEESKDVKIINHPIIYKITEEYEEWKEEKRKEKEREALQGLVMPAKIIIMPHCIFRQSSPAVVGVEVLAGEIRTRMPVTKNGEKLTEIKSIQHEGENVTTAKKGEQVAIALPNVTVGRQIKEGLILYSNIPEPDFRRLKELKHLLKKEDINIMKELADLKRRNNSLWGI